MKFTKIKLRIVLFSLLGLIIFCLLWLKILPDGRAVYQTDFTQDNYFIGKLTPAERVKPENIGVELKGDPVYFSLFTPRRFSQASLNFEYKLKSGVTNIDNNYTLPIIESGVLVDNTIWRYDLKPVDNLIINNLSAEWNSLKKGDFILLERKNPEIKHFNSIEDFLNNLPPLGQIGLYNHDLKVKYLIAGYQPEIKTAIIDYALRGDWQFYTYIKKEELDISCIISDVNQNRDSDEVNLDLYYQDQLIDTAGLPDDGITTDNSQTIPARQVKLNARNLPEGVYKIALRAGDDIITESITSRQKVASFINRIWLANSRQKNIKIYSDATRMQFTTSNPVSLQKIKINDKLVDINQTYKQFRLDEINSNSVLELEKGDLIISGNGTFAFNSSGLINPNFKKVDGSFDIKNSQINYILADYRQPENRDGWQIAKVDIDLSGAYREKGKYNFIISIPGLRADDDIDDGLLIKGIKVELRGKNLYEYIKSIFK